MPKKAVYIQVDEVEARPMHGCAGALKRDLLRSEALEVSQIVIRGRGAAGSYGTEEADRLQYVLAGEATLRQGGGESRIGAGQLVVVPRGVHRGAELSLISDRLTLLEIVPRTAAGSGGVFSEASRNASIRVIRPEEVQPYAPAGHVKTVNRCLFENDQVEIIEGRLEPGGGAEEHLHEEHEQMLYVLEGSDRPLLIHYPRGTPHGTGGGIDVPLKLLVIYSPPLGEARAVLKY